MGGFGHVGGGYGPVYTGHNPITTQLLLWRARRKSLAATEAMMEEQGIEVPETQIWAPHKIWWFGFACGLVLGLFIGLVFWELT
jgi:hypothetical protein